MDRFVTYEHHNNGYEPAAMSEADFNSGGRDLVAESGAFVWQFAATAGDAVSQHNAKHDEWAEDMKAGRPEKTTY